MHLDLLPGAVLQQRGDLHAQWVLGRLDVIRLGLAALSCAAACGGGDYRPGGPERQSGPPIADGRGAPAAVAAPAAGEPGATGGSASVPVEAARDDAPEISRSVGGPGVVVVLWPRVAMPRGTGGPDAVARDAARVVQAELADIVSRALPGVVVDVRPEPERVCPRPGGCRGPSVGALLARAGERGCSVVALVSRAGESPAHRVPWAGAVTLSAAQVGFREPPESGVRFGDMARCDALLDAARAGNDAVLRAVREAGASR